jgi:phosphohistidine phosphatase
MRLLLCRHAEAVDSDDSLSDENRWLTKHGRQQARDVGNALRKHGLELDRVCTSPLVRAVQTADLLAEELRYAKAVQVMRPLAPGGRLSAVLAQLEQQAEPKELVALVGHEPQMSEWAARLLGQPVFERSFKKGAVLCLEWPEMPEIGSGKGIFFIAPKPLVFEPV